MRFASRAFVKAIVVAVVALLLLVPVQMLRNLVIERAQMREQAIASVSRGWGGRQMLGGPVLVIPATATRRMDWYRAGASLEEHAPVSR